MLEIFALKNFDSEMKQKYKKDQRKVKNDIFKTEVKIEKEGMKDDKVSDINLYKYTKRVLGIRISSF